jgi:ABC-2 type transport system permease protein
MNTWPFAISTILIILLPFVLAIALRRRRPVPWLYFIVGVFTFLGARIVHLLLNELLYRVGVLPEEMPEGITLVVTAVVLGLSAALTEELARVVGYKLFPKARRFRDGVMMGLGHGGVEAIIVGVLLAAGVSALWNLDPTALLPQGATAGDYATLEKQLELIDQSALIALAPLVERVIAMGAQITFSVLVLTAFARSQWLYLLVAILYHTVFNAVAVLGSIQFENPWIVELLLFLLILPGLFWLFRQRSSEPEDTPASNRGWRDELKVFWSSCRKELQFQWRTKRVLIVVAIFLVFGMLSPVIAKFTPELISGLEEAAAFAELIPEPSVIDSINQYVSNLTQFGFILVILLGMNAVAGEKEKGTAAMVLSKPIPRWSFILSKYIAQGLVYLLAISLAGLAAYYYTIYLFDGLQFAGFALANFLLYLWLMIFAAVSLLGSSIGKTTAAAAGISLLAGIILLLSGAIPRYGSLFSSGLVNWATASSLNFEGAANGGALAMSLGLILLMLVGAIASIEEQEI